MKRFILCIILSLILIACGGDSGSNSGVDSGGDAGGNAGDGAGGGGAAELFGTVDPYATPKTRALFNNLISHADSNLFFGVESATTLGVFMLENGVTNWAAADGTNSDVNDICGQHPMVYGFDVSSITGDWWIGSPDRETMMAEAQNQFRNHMKLIDSRGGVITMAWHQHHPVTGEDYRTGPRQLWRILPPDTCSDIEARFPEITDCGSHFSVFKEKIDTLSDFFLSLNADDGTPIPVIFRPFHENSGGWFWWGGENVEINLYNTILTSLWSWMVDYMNNVREIHSLLWAISPNGRGYWDALDAQTYLSYTPGLDLVDILGIDFYYTNLSPDAPPAEQYGSQFVDVELAMVVELAETHHKVAALTETGALGGSSEWTDNFWQDNIIGPVLDHPIAGRLSYLHVWTNHPEYTRWGPYLSNPSSAGFQQLCDDERISLEGDANLFQLP